MQEKVFRQANGDWIQIEKLPDGSMAILDKRSKNLHSLNPSATALWEACAEGATLARITAAVQETYGAAITPEVIREAVTRLQSAHLIESEVSLPLEDHGVADQGVVDQGRRGALRRVAAAGAIAVPVILTLAASEQRALAFQAKSTVSAD